MICGGFDTILTEVATMKSNNAAEVPSAYSKVVDTPTIDDLLDFSKFALPIANRVSSATEKNTPMTIGVYGEWGSGKTSFLLMIEDELKKKGITPIWFNAWKYEQEENLWSALIQTILDQAHVQGGFFQRNFVKMKLWFSRYDLRAGSWEIVKKLTPALLRLALFLVGVGLFIGYSVQEIEQSIAQLLPNLAIDARIIAFATKIIVGLASLIALKPESLLKLFDVRLGIDFSKLVREQSYREHIAFLDRFSSDFQNIVNQIGSGKPLVVIIDDLDRCLPEKSLQVLEAIKLFLDVKNCVFLLAVDREVIERAIATKYKDTIEMLKNDRVPISRAATFLGENYFEKIIQLPFSLPPVSEENIENLIKNIVSDDHVDDYSKIFAAGLPKNPRKVKRILQTFLFLRELAAKQIENGEIKLSLLAKLVLIQNQFRSLYLSVIDSPEILSHLEQYFLIQLLKEKNENIDEEALLSMLDPILRKKIEVLATDYLPVRDILLWSRDEGDTFINAKVENYVFLLRAVTSSPTISTEAIGDQEIDVYFRKYLRRLLATTTYLSPQGIQFETQDTDDQFVDLRFLASKEKIEITWKEIAKKSARIVILGDGGIGKTVFLQHVARLHARSILNNDQTKLHEYGFQNAMFPILIPLGTFGDLLDGGKKTFMSALSELLINSAVPEEIVENIFKYIEEGKCILLFDGLDEIESEKRYFVTETINLFVGLYPTNFYLISSRTNSFERGVQLRGFDSYVILPWNDEQVNEYIQRRFSKYPEKLENFMTAYSENRRKTSLEEYPYTLAMNASIYETEGRIPSLESHVDVMLQRWDQSKGIESNYSSAEIRKLHEVIAINLEQLGEKYIEKSKAITLISKTLEKPQLEATQMLNEIMERTGFLIEDDGELYFRHSAIRDFFLPRNTN